MSEPETEDRDRGTPSGTTVAGAQNRPVSLRRPHKSTVILGVDPGTALTGYGVLEKSGTKLRALAYGVVRTPSDAPLHDRLDRLFGELSELLRVYSPDAAAVESLFFNVNVKTALAVGHARGVALLACSRQGCALFEYTPQQVKQAVVGYGKADKRQVQEMVRTLLALKAVPRPDDAADALGVAICHANSHELLSRAAATAPQGAGERRRRARGTGPR
ncbi:MAG: hypothetical protein Kow00129_01650 [Thermoleophilia bacterium]